MTDSKKSICLPNKGKRRMKKVKMWLTRMVGVILLIVLSPGLVIIGLLVWVLSRRPIFFKQRRIGLKGKVFWLYKFRTMYVGAEADREEYKEINEADGPVFKIKNDPRFTKIGKFLSHSGIDELPQLINIWRGEMALIGPRPLPIYEEEKIKEKYRKKRRSILPGIISVWVLKGSHENFTFEDWMKMDVDYVDKKSMFYDSLLFLKSIKFVTVLFLKAILS